MALRYDAWVPFATNATLLDLLQMLQLRRRRDMRRRGSGPIARVATSSAAAASTATMHRQRLSSSSSQCRTQIVCDFRLDEQLFEYLCATQMDNGYRDIVCLGMLARPELSA